MEVTGAVRAKLWFSSDVADTDLVVKLVDVYPDGYAMLLSVGQLRLRYRNGYSRVAMMKPGERYEVDVELGSISNLFAAGHRIRVDITSSDYPRLEPNPNTGAASGTSAVPVVARNTVHFSTTQPFANRIAGDLKMKSWLFLTSRWSHLWSMPGRDCVSR